MLEITHIILRRKKYKKIAILGLLVMFALSYYLTVVNVAEKSIYIYAEINGYLFTITSLVLTLLVAIMTGVYLSLFIFRKDLSRKDKTKGGKKDGVAGAFGGGVNLVASGCPTCGVPLLGLIGIPSALMVLPYKGLELKLLSVIILIISIHYISLSIKKNLSCGLNTSK